MGLCAAGRGLEAAASSPPVPTGHLPRLLEALQPLRVACGGRRAWGRADAGVGDGARVRWAGLAVECSGLAAAHGTCVPRRAGDAVCVRGDVAPERLVAWPGSHPKPGTLQACCGLCRGYRGLGGGVSAADRLYRVSCPASRRLSADAGLQGQGGASQGPPGT